MPVGTRSWWCPSRPSQRFAQAPRRTVFEGAEPLSAFNVQTSTSDSARDGLGFQDISPDGQRFLIIREGAQTDDSSVPLAQNHRRAQLDPRAVGAGAHRLRRCGDDACGGSAGGGRMAARET